MYCQMWWLLKEWRINWAWLNPMEFTQLRFIGLLERICFPSLFSAVLNTWEALKRTHSTESHSILGFLAVDNLREILNKSCRLSLPPFLPFLSSSILPSFHLFPSLSPYNLISSMNYKGILGIILILMNLWTIEWLCYEFVTLIGSVQNVPKKSQMQISLLTLKQCWTKNCILHCKVCFIIILHCNT